MQTLRNGTRATTALVGIDVHMRVRGLHKTFVDRLVSKNKPAPAQLLNGVNADFPSGVFSWSFCNFYSFYFFFFLLTAEKAIGLRIVAGVTGNNKS